MNPMDWNAQEGPSSMREVSADDNIVVTISRILYGFFSRNFDTHRLTAAQYI